MALIRIALLEDNQIDSMLLQMFLAEPPTDKHQFQLVGAFEAVDPLLETLQTTKVDLVLSDIFVQKRPIGLTLLEQLNRRFMPVILITNSLDTAVFETAQRMHCLRFLSKPLNQFTLHSAIDSVYNEAQLQRKYDFTDQKYIYLRGRGGNRNQVLFGEITHIESDRNYCYIYTITGKYAVKQSLIKLLTHELDDRFIRVHQRFAVNKAFIKQVADTHLVISDKLQLPMGKSYQKLVLDFTKKLTSSSPAFIPQ